MRDYSRWMQNSYNDSEEMTFDLCEKSLVNINNSALSYECIINDANEWQKNVDNILLIKQSIFNVKHGDWITYESNDYLVMFEPEDRSFFWSAKMRKCNHTLSLQGEETCTVIGYDDFGRPVEKCTPGTPIPIPCIIETTFYQADESQEPINLPEGKVRCTIPFTSHKDLILGGEITLWDEPYKITGIDKSQSLNNTGLMILHAELVVN